MDGSGSVWFTLLMLTLLLVSWLLGYFTRGRQLLQRTSHPDPDYFVGLNYLLNDEPDDAIDVFIDALEVNSSTFETHLALGKLLRRRGKVDRSIEHYEALLGSRRFNIRQSAEFRIQLLRSYIAAGLLDRAEQTLQELRTTSPSLRIEALKQAVTLYQMEKEWKLALEAAAELLKLTPVQHRHDLQVQITHFHCELAELALQKEQTDLAQGELKQALALYKGNMRVHLLQARLFRKGGAHQDAFASLCKAVQLEPALFEEVLPELKQMAAINGAELMSILPAEFERELRQESAYRIEIARQEQASKGGDEALAYLLDSLRDVPSLQLLRHVFELAAHEAPWRDAVLDSGIEVLSLHLQSLPRYRCENCGFELRHLHWSCPGCSGWGMVKPINNLITPGADHGAAVNL